MNSFNNLEIYIMEMDSNTTIIGAYVRDSGFPGKKTFRDCLEVTNDGLQFFEMIDLCEPESVDVFTKETRARLIELISKRGSSKDNDQLENFLFKYEGVQYFGELANILRKRYGIK